MIDALAGGAAFGGDGLDGVVLGGGVVVLGGEVVVGVVDAGVASALAPAAPAARTPIVAARVTAELASLRPIRPGSKSLNHRRRERSLSRGYAVRGARAASGSVREPTTSHDASTSPRISSAFQLS